MNETSPTDIIGAAMWQLVERYTGKIGYKGGVKVEGLGRTPPVIDCSGWTSLLLSTAMKAANGTAGRDEFGSEDIRAIHTWSDRLIQEIETRWGRIIEGDRITGEALPRYATIRLRQGGGAWATNHPRPRSITHVVQIVRRPGDDAPFVTESQGWAQPFGLRLLPLSDWLNITESYLRVGEAWAVDAFATTRLAGRSASR